ncbi:hypothetical protein TNCT_415641 [Trichonephila clavata]|uniref:Uncharacterized protein n=1 Tax=Trichonephila clavata TaxID=2740835 RepID=A0A8X6IE58_TRICU|nr:hypothetical protein TNCT_415641 [Trichonephila clavata]
MGHNLKSGTIIEIFMKTEYIDSGKTIPVRRVNTSNNSVDELGHCQLARIVKVDRRPTDNRTWLIVDLHINTKTCRYEFIRINAQKMYPPHGDNYTSHPFPNLKPKIVSRENEAITVDRNGDGLWMEDIFRAEDAISIMRRQEEVQ